MNRIIKITFAVLLIPVVICVQDKICEHFGFEQTKRNTLTKVTKVIEVKADEKKLIMPDIPPEGDYFINDTIYRWDEQLTDWVKTKETLDDSAPFANTRAVPPSLSEPIVIDWKVLMDIGYKRRYFSEMEMEMYAPVFPKALETLHEKEVIIEGFVIPFDVEEELMALSFNPYSSCFFCGKASPASVISMYLKRKNNRYKIDDFKKFRGTFYLNYDDPDEFYYILRDARE